MGKTLPSKSEKGRVTSAPGKRAIIFARVGNAQHTGAERAALLAVQQDYCRDVAGALQAEVIEEYMARGGTTEPAVRQIVEQLLQTVDRGGIDYIIVHSFERLTRRPDDLARIVARLHANGARLVTTADPGENLRDTISLFCFIRTGSERRA